MENILRGYQSKTAGKVREALSSGYNAPIVVSPCGTGKTHIFIYIAVMAAKKGYRTCIIVHRSYLWQQVSKKLTELGVPHGIIAPGQTKTNDLIQVASVDTLVRRLDKYKKFNCLILDEAHHVVGKNKWGKVVQYYRCKIIGFTATANRTSGQGLGVSAGGFFDKIIYGPQIMDVTPEYLAPLRLFSLDVGVFETKGIKKIAGDYARNDLLKIIDKKKIYGEVISHYMTICPGIPAIVFCVSINHAEMVAEEFNQNGIPAAAVSSRTHERKRTMIFDGFARGRYKVICSCDLISEGFDVPNCGAVLCLRHTQSITLCIQQWGRAGRIYPGKKFGYILDFVGNHIRHGMPDADRIWDLEGVKFGKKTTEDCGVEPTRTCPKCFLVQSISPVCRGYLFDGSPCGHVFLSFEELPVVDASAKLVEIETARLEKVEKKKNRETAMKKARSLGELYEVAKQLKYNARWADHVWDSRVKKFEDAKTRDDFFYRAYCIGLDKQETNIEWEKRLMLNYKQKGVV